MLIHPHGKLDICGGENMLSYQKLDVYQCSIQFIALVALLICKLPRGYFFLADELKRGRGPGSPPQPRPRKKGKTWGVSDRQKVGNFQLTITLHTPYTFGARCDMLTVPTTCPFCFKAVIMRNLESGLRSAKMVVPSTTCLSSRSDIPHCRSIEKS